MPQDDSRKPDARPAGASKPPSAAAKDGAQPGRSGGQPDKSADREARLAEALRANLRRRKAASRPAHEKEDR